jgi:hypothetical protein
MIFPEIFKVAETLSDSETWLDGNEYKFCIMLMNSDGDFIQLPNRVIAMIKIEDDLFSPFSNGVIFLDNRFDSFENYHVKNAASAVETDRPRSFRLKHDGLDLALIKIRPILRDDKAEPLANETNFPDHIWELSYIFSIYDEDERHQPNTIDRKVKALYLKDAKEQILSQTNIHWSTAEMLDYLNMAGFDVTQASNGSRGVHVGDGIRYCIEKSFKDKKFLNQDISNEFDPQWEKGRNKSFYSSPAEFSAMDDIETLLDRMVSADVLDNCILQYNRDRIWSLLPFSEYFDRVFTKDTRLPGDFHIDLFPLAQPDGPGAQDNIKMIPGMSRNAFDLDMNIDDFAGLSNYSFADISTTDSMSELISHAVHSYNPRTKKFSIDIKNHNIKNAKADFQKLYIDKKMYGESPDALIPFDNSQEENKILKHTFSGATDPIERYKKGRNSIFNKSIALAPCMTFDLPGLTYRRSGRFLSIVNTQDTPDVPFQDIMQGQWLITNVVHTIAGASYRNSITCSKPYSYKKIGL